MKTKGALQSSFLECCTREEWDWMMKLPVPTNLTWEATEKLFRRWVLEIEMADGTVQFRWARMIIRPDDGRPAEHYVLLGGLNAAEWRWWAKRWSAMSGEIGSHGTLEYRKGKQPLSAAIKKVLGK